MFIIEGSKNNYFPPQPILNYTYVIFLLSLFFNIKNVIIN